MNPVSGATVLAGVKLVSGFAGPDDDVRGAPAPHRGRGGEVRGPGVPGIPAHGEAEELSEPRLRG